MLKKIVANICSAVSRRSAKRSANTASRNGYYQPNEPVAVANLRKQK